MTTNPLCRSFVWVLALSCAMPACVIGNDKYPRPRDLSPTWLVDRTRVLAVVAEPRRSGRGSGQRSPPWSPPPGRTRRKMAG